MRANDRSPRRRIRPLPPQVLRPLGIDPPSMVRSLNAADQRRVQSYSPLAYQLAWKFARHNARDVPADELISEALYGLTYAAGLFDESRGVPFGAYATLVIRHRLIHAIIRWRRARRIIVPLPVRFGSEGETWEAEDRNPPPEAHVGAAAREMCERVRRILPARWYTALRLYHAEGYSLSEVAARMGITRNRVRQLLDKAQDQARESFPRWVRPESENFRQMPP